MRTIMITLIVSIITSFAFALLCLRRTRTSDEP